MLSEFRNWSDLRVFLVVCREGSTLAASRLLNMAQPTVARRVDALEHELGLTLFDRDTRGFHPTDAALALLPHAQAVEAAAQTLAATATGLSRPRPIRVTAFEKNFSYRIMAIFNGFTDAHPDVGFEFIRSATRLDLMAGEADVALRISYGEEHPDLICRLISTAQFTLYGSSGYSARHGLPKTPEDMAGHCLFSLRREGLAPVIHSWFLRHVSADQITRTLSEVGLLDAAIRAGQGLGIMNLRLVAAEEAAGELIRCFEPPPELSARHQMLISPEAYRRPEVRAFTAYFAPRYAALFK